MVTVGSFDAKTHLPALLERVARGEVIQITKRGVPIARLVPALEVKKLDVKQAVHEIRQSRKGITLGHLEISSLKTEGRS